MSENSGGDVNYYRVEVAHPKRAEPYVAECEDIIAALGMDFFEGEAFKAAWRKAAQRTLGLGKEGNTALRDAQKMAHYGARCLAIEVNRTPVPMVCTEAARLPRPVDWRREDVIRFVGVDCETWRTGRPYRVLGEVKDLKLRVSHEGTGVRWMPIDYLVRNFEWEGRP